MREKGQPLLSYKTELIPEAGRKVGHVNAEIRTLDTDDV